MLAPFLFVGLGGSGGKTLRTVRQELWDNLRDAGWEGDFPRSWQFRHIDVPVTADGNDPGLPPQLPTTQYVSLVPAHVPYRDMDEALWAASRGAEATRNSLAGWRPRTNEVAIPVSKGAGQFRTIGRVITLANLEKVKRSLASAFSTLDGPEIPGELQRLSKLLGSSSASSSSRPDPVVVMVTSIAGGSGAGMFLDIADVIRATGGGPGDHCIGIMFAPDVFDELPEGARRGVRPNAVAALSELMAGYWTRSGPTDEHDALFRQSGIVLGSSAVSGPRYPILVGRRNSRVSFGTQNDAYLAMGRALAAWVRDEPVQDKLNAYTVANWENTAQSVADALPLKLNGQGTPFSALGFGRVSIGRPQFRRYSREHLARRCVDGVLRDHLKYRREDDHRPDHELVNESASTNFRRFVEEAKLNELGPADNEILEALRPTAVVKDRASRLHKEVMGALRQSAKGAEPGPVWAREIQAQTRRFSNQVRDELRQVSLEGARKWVKTSEAQLVATTADYIARLGGPVTVELLHRLQTELGDVATEMERESSQYRSWAADSEQLPDLIQRDGKIEVEHEDVLQAAKQAASSVAYVAEAELRELTRSLVEEFAELVVEPLRIAVDDSVGRLGRDEVAAEGGRPSEIKAWPTGDEVPVSVRPAVNELYLEPVESFPSALRAAVKRTLGTEAEAPAMKQAVHEVTTGDFGRSSDARLIEIVQPWAHSNHTLYEGARSDRTRGAYAVELKPEQILDRADRWISRPDTAIGRMVQERLGEYLRGETKEAAERREHFARQFLAAIDLAEPLVNINSGLLGIVHPGRREPAMQRVASQIPFSEGHPGRRAVEELLKSRGWEDHEIPSLFTDHDREHIDVFTVLGEPYEPVVFDSLMKPIAEEWGARKGDVDARATFWRWRRSRPLVQAIPVAEAVRRAMVRGWFTARLLGQVKVDQDGTTSVYVPSGHGAPGRFLPFPDPLLAPVSSEADRLAVVLMSMVLAFADLTTSGSLDAIAPYERLRALGTSGRGGLESYDSPNEELSAWVLNGEIPPTAPTPPEHLAGSKSDEVSSRREAIVARLEAWTNSYQRVFSTVDQRADVFDVQPAWELRDDISNALEVVSEQVRHVRPTVDEF